MDLIARTLRVSFTRAMWEQAGGGFALRQTIPYLSPELYRDRTYNGARYTERNSGFLITNVYKSGSSWVAEGGTLGELTVISLSNGFGAHISSAAGALSTALVASQNRVFSFFVPEPITIRLVTSISADSTGNLTVEKGDVTFYPACWQLWALSSADNIWVQYVTELLGGPVLNTIPTVDYSAGGVLGVHNIDSFFYDPPVARGVNFPSLTRTAPPPGDYSKWAAQSIVYGFYSSDQSCVWYIDLANANLGINYFSSHGPGVISGAPAYSKAIYQ